MSPAEPPIPVYVDCDTGIDDALALAYLLSRPDVRVVGVGTVSGNVDSVTAAMNTLGILDIAGRHDIPVAIGAMNPWSGAFQGGALHVHGKNGVGGVAFAHKLRPHHNPAIGLLSELAEKHANNLRLIAIGPLTNIAEAFATHPALPGKLHSLTVMGGAFGVAGNVTRYAEANIASDPEAAAHVFEAPVSITVVPLDATMSQRFGVTDQRALAESDSKLNQALAAMLGTYFDFHTPIFGYPGCALHDPFAAAVAVDPTWADATIRGEATVETSNVAERGRTTLIPTANGNRSVVLSGRSGFAAHLRNALAPMTERVGE